MPDTEEGFSMRGTTDPTPRCTALKGTIGTRTGCTIYANRPSECRDFEASWEFGERNPDCDRARARHGLPRLTLADWR